MQAKNKAVAQVFGRGFTIVSLTAAQVMQISMHHYGAAFLVGGAISTVWWTNAHRAGVADAPWCKWVYGLGAGCGSLFGMWLVQEVYR